MPLNDIVIICLDTVRKDYFDEHASRLRSLADVSFDQCRTASSWSVPSHASMFTGELPHEHGYHAHNRIFSNLTRADTFLTNLPHRPVCVSANPYLTPMLGMDDVFDETVAVPKAGRYPRSPRLGPYMTDDDSTFRSFADFLTTAVSHDHPVRCFQNVLDELLKIALDKLPVPQLLDEGAKSVIPRVSKEELDEDEPTFLFANYMEAHAPLRHLAAFDRALHSAPDSFSTADVDPWELMAEFDEYETYLRHRRDLYGAAIEYLDRCVSAFVEDLLETSGRDTTVIVTADHGENLGHEHEGYHVGHKSSLSESLLHVPFLIFNPPTGIPDLEETYFSHLDMGDLISGMVTGTVPDLSRSRVPAELLGLVKSQEPPSNRAFWNRAIRCSFHETSKTIWDSLGNCVRYELDFDRPCWQREVEDEATPRSADLDLFDDDIRSAKRTAKDGAKDDFADVGDEMTKRLQNLGYM